jgi:hypothetical protein
MMESTYPRSWNWAEDGELYGAYRETRRVETRDGPRSVIEFKLVDTGEPVCIWLSAQVLRSTFVEELKRRIAQGDDDFKPGEKIRISRGEKRPSQTGNGYWPFEVEFEHAARLTASDILLADDEADEPGAGDNDIPF